MLSNSILCFPKLESMFKFRMDFKSLLVACSVHPEILRASHFKPNHPSWSSAWSDKKALPNQRAGGRGGCGGERWQVPYCAWPRLPAQPQDSGWLSSWYMHVKSGLLQLWKVTTCSKGCTARLLFPSISTAHSIHGQAYSVNGVSSFTDVDQGVQLSQGILIQGRVPVEAMSFEVVHRWLVAVIIADGQSVWQNLVGLFSWSCY